MLFRSNVFDGEGEQEEWSNEMSQGLPTTLHQRGHSYRPTEIRSAVENVPIVQPVDDLWHLLNQKYAVSVYSVSRENPGPLSRDPLFDII